MKIEHAVMRLKWMLFGVALLLGCVLFNQVTLLELVWLSLPVALVGFIIVLCNLILLGVETRNRCKRSPRSTHSFAIMRSEDGTNGRRRLR